MHWSLVHLARWLVAPVERRTWPQSGHSARPTAPRLLCTLSRDCVGARKSRAYLRTHRSARSAPITCLTSTSYPVPNCGTQKLLRKTGQVTAVTVGAPVAALAAKTERRRVVFKVVPSRSMHWPSALARGATGGGRPDLRDALAGAVRACLAAAAECSAATLAAKTER